MADVAADENGITAVSMSKINDSANHSASASKYEIDEKAKEPGKADVKDKKEKEKVENVGCFALFRFAGAAEWALMIFGSIAAIGTGISLPLMILVFGEMTNAFVGDQLIKFLYDELGLASQGISLEQLLTNATVRQYVKDVFNITWDYTQETLESHSTNDILDQMTGYTYLYVGIGCASLVAAYMQTTFWLLAAERQTMKIRRLFFRAIMRQEIGWFDTHDSGELNSRLSDDLIKIHDGIGDKVANFLQWFACCLGGIVLGFVKGWKLTLVTLSVSPLLVVASVLMAKIVGLMTNQELKAYAKAGAVAEEVISAIRTVVSFGGQKRECERYNRNLGDAARLGTRKALINGVSLGFVWFVIFSAYGLGFWYGAKLVREESEYNAGTILIVFFSVIMAAFSLGSAFPNLQHVATARGAAFTIFGIIDQEPLIDSSDPKGKKLKDLRGKVEFRNVKFNYPSRPDVTVLDGLSLSVDVGQTAALVGPSGCGKSTTVQLLSRFYDVLGGSVMIDGVDVRELSLPWLRRQLGVVSQEPVLFATTIAENIRYGKDGVTDEEIEQACRMSNAHDFVSALPDKYNTIVGERGAQLSGGQKQRIAIARALIRNPRLLLLDEATSALDTESEHVVQEALEKASEGRTTIVIAHRLSTIKNANIIMGLKDGRVAESGSHEELMAKQGLYHTLVTNQTTHFEEDEDDAGAEEVSEELQKLKKQLSQEGDGEAKHKLDQVLSKHGAERQLSRQLSSDMEAAAQADQEEGDKEPSGCCAKLKKKKKSNEPEAPSLKRLLVMNGDQWPYILLGTIAALLNGGIQPAFAVLFAEILAVFAEISPEEQEERINLFCILFLALGIFSFFSQFFQVYMFSKSGESLTMKLRQMCFRKVLSFEMSWFDNPSNSTGAICTKLATEASMVQGASGSRLGQMVMTFSVLFTSIVLAFVYGWQLTLVILAFVPVMILSGIAQMQVMAGSQQSDKEAYEGAGKLSTEAISNIRTVATLTKEEMFFELYMAKLAPVYKSAVKKAHVQGIAYGLSQAVMFFAYAASFQMGAYLIKKGDLNFEQVMKVFSAVIYGAMGVGQATALAPDYGKAKLASAKIFALLDRVSLIDSLQEEGDKPSSSEGRADLNEVRFRYPTRPDVPVLRGLNLEVPTGQTIALVGSSGCGKSTVIQLIQRFYDPLLGQVLLDGHDLTTLQPAWARAQLGIVAQEATLFDSSIRENIAYGDLSRDIPMEEIISAARSANIHNFIETLPKGYDTNVGDKGTQLSGGQKQRIAIARALIRAPKLLLLDEATSALDTESEKVVQEALERAQEGRTCIVIAHRLSTIQNADVICVLHHGKVVEMGNHQTLMAKQGRYHMLQKKGRKAD